MYSSMYLRKNPLTFIQLQQHSPNLTTNEIINEMMRKKNTNENTKKEKTISFLFLFTERENYPL